VELGTSTPRENAGREIAEAEAEQTARLLGEEDLWRLRPALDGGTPMNDASEEDEEAP
jgi:hypothetical protein